MKNRTTEHRERLDAHVLVCMNSRESYDCCADAGSSEVLTEVKQWLRDRDAFWSTVSVVETSCLGLCSADGAAISIQPHNHWFSDVTPEEVPALLESVFGPDAERVTVDATTAVDSQSGESTQTPPAQPE